MKTLVTLVLIFLAGVAFGQELPVTRVVLFTSGVGFFEHSGTVTGDGTVPLTFTADQINDVLKSLILRDPTGAVGVVGYPSQDPIDKSLGSFALDLGGPGGLAALLPQLRGAALTLSTPTELTGRLVGLDTRTSGNVTDTWLTLSTEAGLRVVPLSSVLGLKLLDPKLDQELQQALTLLAGSRDAGKRVVTAHFSGKGQRTVTLGYIVESPVWKTSYRLDLTGGKPFLQAWALVENPGETDWTQVKLALVSGRPVSFIQDLYTPQYVERPLYQPVTEAGPAPRVNRAGVPSASRAEAPSPAPAPQAMASKAARELDLYDEAAPVELRSSGVSAAAGGAQAGELFQFSLQAPITLPRHQSALIPLAATDVAAQKVSLFNADVDSLHPQNAVWITNSTGLRLPAGPVTVYDGGVYAGDALTDTLLEKDKRLWTYASDLAVRAVVNPTSGQTTSKITVAKGVLNYRRELTWNTDYQFTNAGTEARTVLIEHPVRSERTLVAPAAPTEKTADVYRFSLALAPGGTSTLVVKEARTVVETQGLAGWRAEQILALVQSTGPLSPAAKSALQKLAEVKTRADKAVQDTASLVQQKADAENSQSRIRSNLSAVGRDTTQGAGYLQRLADSEALIDSLTKQITDARAAQTTAQRALDDALASFTVE